MACRRLLVIMTNVLTTNFRWPTSTKDIWRDLWEKISLDLRRLNPWHGTPKYIFLQLDFCRLSIVQKRHWKCLKYDLKKTTVMSLNFTYDHFQRFWSSLWKSTRDSVYKSDKRQNYILNYLKKIVILLTTSFYKFFPNEYLMRLMCDHNVHRRHPRSSQQSVILFHLFKRWMF